MIDKYQFFEAVGYSPHAGQQPYHASDKRFRLAVCGRRFGKSKMCALDKLALLFDPGNPVKGWIVGPTYALGEKEFKYMWEIVIYALKLGAQIKRKANNVRSGEMYIEFPWGSRIDVKSADYPDGLVGEGLDFVLMVEAAKLGPDIFSKYIRPALADRRGTADFVTTPEGYNWFKTLHDDALANPEWDVFHFPSWTNSYVFPGGKDDPEITVLRETMSDAEFRQEICAEFTAFAGRIYDEFDNEANVDEWTYDPRLPNYLAFDFGFTNPFVCLDVQVTPSEAVHVWREYYIANLPVHRHAEAIVGREQPKDYRVEFATGDPADPGAIRTLEDFKVARFLPCDKDVKDVTRGITAVKRLLNVHNRRLFVAKSCVNTIWEFNNYRTKDTNKREVNDQEQPRKWADHALDAIRYFVMQRFEFGAGYHLSEIMDVYDKEPAGGSNPNQDNDSRGIFTLSGGVL